MVEEKNWGKGLKIVSDDSGSGVGALSLVTVSPACTSSPPHRWWALIVSCNDRVETMSVLPDHDHVRELFAASLDDTCAFHFYFNGTNLHACIINYAAGWVFSNVTFSFPGKVRWLQKLCLTSSSQVSSRQQFVSDQILIIVVVIHPKSG